MRKVVPKVLFLGLTEEKPKEKNNECYFNEAVT